MVFRHRYLDFVVTEFERELSAPKKLLVVPAIVVGVGDEPRKPLSEEVNVGVVVLEVFVSIASADPLVVDNVEGPIDGEGVAVARLEGIRQVDAHHRIHNSVFQRPSPCV